MGTLVKQQLVVVPLILFFVIGSCTAAQTSGMGRRSGSNGTGVGERAGVQRVPSGAEGLGQNLYWLSPAGLTPEEDRGAVQSWVEEKADWTPSPIPDGCAEGKMCGHYTQVVWRDTTHVGCASAQCPDGSGMWVCNYSLTKPHSKLPASQIELQRGCTILHF
ncbi:unnamed protein product [Closterium sp. NIES-64]|nr:unnamed protein product [Closterium sp. NIES-64]